VKYVISDETIATILKNEVLAIPVGESAKTHHRVANMFAIYFSATYKRFDRTKFIKSCGVQEREPKVGENLSFAANRGVVLRDYRQSVKSALVVEALKQKGIKARVNGLGGVVVAEEDAYRAAAEVLQIEKGLKD
jgi:hypothetical protein